MALTGGALSLVAAQPAAASTSYKIVAGSGGANLRSTPSTASPSNIIGGVWNGSRVEILCTQQGTTEKGPLGTTSLWDRVRVIKTGATGFVSDSLVKTGHSGAVAGPCSGSSTGLVGREAARGGAAGALEGTSEMPPSYTPGGNLTANDLADLWLAGKGGRFQFTDGDQFTEQVRKDPWLGELTYWLSRNGEGGPQPTRASPGFNGQKNKSLGSIKETWRAAGRDPGNVLAWALRLDTNNGALTYLGSYQLKYQVEPLPENKIKITYDIYNVTSVESATRIPVVGYRAEARKSIREQYEDGKVEDSRHPRQFQRIHMTFVKPMYYPAACDATGAYCPPRNYIRSGGIA